jgi:hypothetical protein
MKQFNKNIHIEVSVDAIAARLLDSMKESPIAEHIVEAVIGSALAANHGLNAIYNAVCGFSNELTYKVGDNCAISTEYISTYNFVDSLKKFDYVLGKVVAINEYAKCPITVEIEHVNSKNYIDTDRKDIPLCAISNAGVGEWCIALEAAKESANLFK